MASPRKAVTLQRPSNSQPPSFNDRKVIEQLHSIFDARVKDPSSMEGTSSSSSAAVTTSTGSAVSSPKHTPITSPCPTPTARGSNNLPSVPSPAASRLLNDPLLSLAKTKPEAGGPSKGASNGAARNGQAVAAKSTAERYCQLCKMKTPLPKTAFIDHILGKRHRVVEYKQKLTKEQKEDRDARTLHVRGFDHRTLPEELCGLFWDFGMVDLQANKSHVFILFSNKQEVMNTLATKVFTSDGKKLITSLRSTRVHVGDPVTDKPVEFFLSPVVKNLLGVLPKSSDQLLDTMDQLLNDIQLRPKEYENRQFVRDRIEHFLRIEFPNVSCHVFGSSANNLGFREADIDLYAALGYDPYDTPRPADGEAAAAKLTHYLAKHLRRQHWVTNVSAIAKARVPIVKFQQNGIAVDLSFRNAMPIQNTALIRLFTLVHPIVRPYMMMVRFWAKTQGLAGGGKPDTLLTNYALTMLMAFVIMVNRKILPSLAELRQQPHRQVIINGWNCGFGEDTQKYSNKNHDCSVLQLVLEFFEYYSSLDTVEWVICPLVGELITTKDMASKSLNKLPSEFEDYVKAYGKLQLETPLCVQDPFDLTHNVTRGLKKIPLERFQLLCKKSAEIVKKIMRLELPLITLFQHIELTDDMYDELNGGKVPTEPVLTSQDVIELDDDDEVEVLEEVRNIFQGYKNGVSKSNEVAVTSAQDAKRSNPDGSSVTTDNDSLLTAAEKQLCNNLNDDISCLFRFAVPTGYDIDLETGDLTLSMQSSDEALQQIGLKLLEFMFLKVYAMEVNKTDISDETTVKKSKNTDSFISPRSSNCLAKLNIVYKYEVREGKVSLRLINSNLFGPHVSPFAFERKLTDLQLEEIDKGCYRHGKNREPFYATFFVCVSSHNPRELVLLANTLNRSKSDQDFLTRFMSSFKFLIQFCFKKIPPHLEWLKNNSSVTNDKWV